MQLRRGVLPWLTASVAIAVSHDQIMDKDGYQPRLSCIGPPVYHCLAFTSELNCLKMYIVTLQFALGDIGASLNQRFERYLCDLSRGKGQSNKERWPHPFHGCALHG